VYRIEYFLYFGIYKQQDFKSTVFVVYHAENFKTHRYNLYMIHNNDFKFVSLLRIPGIYKYIYIYMYILYIIHLLYDIFVSIYITHKHLFI